MKRVLLWLLCGFCFWSSGAYAQKDNTLLWEISGKGLKKPSYLFGTFHLLCPEDIQVTDAVRASLHKTQQLVLELDFDDPAVVPAIQQQMVFANGKTTADYLNATDLDLVSRFFMDSLGMPFDQVAMIKPFMLSTLIYPKYFGCQPASWELTLMQMAQARQSEVLGLETPQQQMAVLDKLTLEQQTKLLLESIRDYEGMRLQFLQMLQMYKDQQVEAMERFAGSYFSEYQEVERAILEDRNRAWIPKIEKWAKRKPTFFAVGAAHLGGKTGVIALLRARGYKVTPVSNTPEIIPVQAIQENETAALLVRKWRMDESVIPQAVEDVLENVRQNNPEQAAVLELQKEMVADGLRATVVEYKANGRFEMFAFGQRFSGTWKLNEDQSKLLRTDEGGEESVNELVEVRADKLVLINSSKKRLVYIPK